MGVCFSKKKTAQIHVAKKTDQSSLVQKDKEPIEEKELNPIESVSDIPPLVPSIQPEKNSIDFKSFCRILSALNKKEKASLENELKQWKTVRDNYSGPHRQDSFLSNLRWCQPLRSCTALPRF